ncbi:uncharacterized protein OCT59_013516 [Rhizophagus irregularis]|uniref:uncharacterized protein n=1 Tax=Rhizophagus irregularis TaxID=588596 RepID=UPI0033299295|nr:hypothetical protein OCT59_013516 [Rhizophagus irregularis]
MAGQEFAIYSCRHALDMNLHIIVPVAIYHAGTGNGIDVEHTTKRIDVEQSNQQDRRRTYRIDDEQSNKKDRCQT